MNPMQRNSKSIKAQSLSGLGGETETGCALGLVEDDELRLEEDVTVDGHANTTVGLDTTEAVGSSSSCVVDVFTRYDGLV